MGVVKIEKMKCKSGSPKTGRWGNCFDGWVHEIRTPDDIISAYKYIYTYSDGRIVVYAHYVDGMEVWEWSPKLWIGGKLMLRKIGEKEVY